MSQRGVSYDVPSRIQEARKCKSQSSSCTWVTLGILVHFVSEHDAVVCRIRVDAWQRTFRTLHCKGLLQHSR